MFHRPDCYTIRSESFRGGGWTNNVYVKVCASGKDSLVDWARRNVENQPPDCRKCHP